MRSIMGSTGSASFRDADLSGQEFESMRAKMASGDLPSFGSGPGVGSDEEITRAQLVAREQARRVRSIASRMRQVRLWLAALGE